jgi:adenylate cyclase
MERRLAAILAADVVGYTRLMGEDEMGTLQRLTALRERILEPLIAEHRGRVVKLMGDGLLVEFASIVDAVGCAVAWQTAVEEHEAEQPEDDRLVFRIGVNLGDVLVEGEDIHGDGVNMAARLEGLAEPGGVCLSGDAYRQVRGKVDAEFEDLGEQEVKNIAEPVRVYRIATRESGAVSAERAGDHLSVSDKPSIAVLPFNNMSGDPEQEFFSDGLSEDIITALSKIARLRVIARNSTFAYKGTSPDVRQVAQDLGVKYVLEGSIRRGGDRLRISAQLIDADDGSHLWAERYDRKVADVFDVQDEITKEIVTALRVRLTDGELALVWARGTNDVEAWQCCIRATELQTRFNSADYLEARKLAERATKRDPNYAHAWAILALTYWWDGRLGFTGDSEAKFSRANELADKAMALDDTNAWVLGTKGMALAPLGQFEEGVAIMARAVELHPGNADVRAFYGIVLVHAGRYEEAVEHIRAAMALNPRYPNFYLNIMTRSLLSMGRYDDALPYSERQLALEPDNLLSNLQYTMIMLRRGRETDARAAIERVRQIAPNLRTRHIRQLYLQNDNDFMTEFAEALNAVGLPE